MEDKTVNIKVSLINNILGYLGEKPFKEVAGIIQEIHNVVLPQLENKGVENGNRSEDQS